MNNKKIILKVVILIFILILGISLYKYKKESPIITIFTSHGTSCYTIKYYRGHATYSEDIGGVGGMVYGKEKIILYSKKIDFKQLKSEIEDIIQDKNNGRIKIIVGNNNVYANKDDEIVKKILSIVNMENFR